MDKSENLDFGLLIQDFDSKDSLGAVYERAYMLLK